MRVAQKLTVPIAVASTLLLLSVSSGSSAAEGGSTKTEQQSASEAKNSSEAKSNTAQSSQKEQPPTTTVVTPAPNAVQTVRKPGPFEAVNERMTRMERRIVEAVSAGRLSSPAAKKLRDDLDRIEEMEAVFRAQPVTTAYWHATALNFELDQLSDKLEHRMHDRDVVPSDLSFMKEDLLKRIDNAASEGRLNPDEVVDLKQEFNRITALEHMLTRLHGRLTYAERLTIAIDLDHLSAQVRRQMSDRAVKPFDVAAATTTLEKRAEEAAKAGQLSNEVLSAVKSQLAEVRETEKNEKNKQDKRNIIALGLWIEEISNRLEEQILIAKSIRTSVQERVASIDKTIAQGLLDGRLTPIEALELSEDLEVVSRQHTTTKGEAPLKPEDELAFSVALARLEGLIERQMHSPTLVWSGALAYHAHLDMRIKEAVAASRLSASEAKELDAKSDAIAASMRSQGGPQRIVKTEAALNVAIALQQLSAAIDLTMKDRSMAEPDVDALQSSLDRRLGDALVSGQLNLDEGRSAYELLNQVTAMKEQFKKSDGALSGRKLWAVAYELQNASTNIEELIHDHPALFPGLEVRRAQIDELLAEGVSSGRLSKEESESFRAVLSQNELLEKTVRSSAPGYTTQQAIELVTGLEKAHARIERLLREKQIPSSDLLAEESKVERKLARFFSLGYLTPLEAESLRRQFGSVVTSLKTLRATAGGLSYGERLAFLYGFERIAAAAERHARSTPLPLPNLEIRYSRVEQKIADALATGKLPVQEARDLKSLLEQMQKSTLRARTSGGGLSYPETLIAVVDVERFSRRVDERMRALKNPLPDIDTKQAQLEKRIDQGKAAGKLTADQVKQLKAELSRIAEGEARFRISDETLNFAETVSLHQDLDSVSKQLDQLISKPVKNTAVPKKPSTASKKAPGP